MRLKANENVSITMWAEVPAKRIISTPFTGPGCLTESEFLVAGGKMPVYFRGARMARGIGAQDIKDTGLARVHLNPWETVAEQRLIRRFGEHIAAAKKLREMDAISESKYNTIIDLLGRDNPDHVKWAKNEIARITSEYGPKAM